MQLRRIVLLFALVLGLVAVVTSLAPPPSERESDPAPPAEAPPPDAQGAAEERTVRLDAAARRRERIPVATGTRLTVVVSVQEPGDVEIEGLGLRQTADPRAPARFDVLASPAGRYRVSFHPVGGRTLPVARLVFEERASLRLRGAAGPGAA